MKNILFILSIVVSPFFLTAQDLSKEEIKNLKKEIKSLTPEQYTQLKNDLASKSTELEELKTQVSELQSTNLSLENQNEELKSEVSKYKEKLNQAASEKKVEEYVTYEDSHSKGVMYKVQIGAFKQLDMRQYFKQHKNFSGEIDPDGTMRYTLGEFRDYWEADKFKKYLRNMGVKGAWIVSYKNGKRVDIKDALEGSL